MNVQVIADTAGRLVRAPMALPGSAHAMVAAQTHGIIAALTDVDVMNFADEAYHAADDCTSTSFKRHRYRPKPSPRQKAVGTRNARPWRPTLVMSFHARTRHTYGGTRRGRRMT